MQSNVIVTSTCMTQEISGMSDGDIHVYLIIEHLIQINSDCTVTILVILLDNLNIKFICSCADEIYNQDNY